MFDNVKNNLYMKKINILYNQGIMDGRIVPFDDAFYEKIKSTTIDAYKPCGKRRSVAIPLVSGIAQISNNEEFISDLNKYLKEVNYNEEQIYNELDVAIEDCFKQKVKNKEKYLIQNYV